MKRSSAMNQKQHLSEIAAELGRRGAEIANAKRSPEERRAIALKAIQARWDRYRRAKRES